MQTKKIDIQLILVLSVALLACLVYMIFPRLEFKSPQANRIFGIAFNVFCIYASLIVFRCLKKIWIKFIRYFITVVNAFFLLILVLNLLLYCMRIDPQIQYYDIETLYWNRTNKFEKIQKQYYINWKSNQKHVVFNKVFDFGPFRNYLQYNIKTEALDDDWVKMK